MHTRAAACAGALAALAILLAAGQARARRADIGRSYSLGAYGGLGAVDRWDVGIQALTLHGPGDSSLVMFHVGLGLDASYARLGEAHQLRLVPVFEALLYLVFVQVGAGAAIDVVHPSRSGADLVVVPGLRLFLGDEYQSPALSAGARLEWIVGRRQVFVPSFFASLSLCFNAW